MMTTCEWRDEYACYQTATCERQPDGAWLIDGCELAPPPGRLRWTPPTG